MLCKYAEKSNQKRLEPSNFQVFFFFNQPKCGFYVTISISTLAVANFQAYYLSVIWSFWSPCLWQLPIGNNNYWVCVTTCKILIFFKSGWMRMRMKWAVHFGMRPNDKGLKPRMSVLETLYNDQFTLSTHLIIPNHPEYVLTVFFSKTNLWLIPKVIWDNLHEFKL